MAKSLTDNASVGDLNSISTGELVDTLTNVPNDLPDDNTMLTTIDNPYSPFTQWDSWWQFDTSKGYNTCAYLARVCQSSSELSDADQNFAISQAMKEIMNLNLTGKYRIVSREDSIPKVRSV
jgi:hypothetical protein